MRVVYDSSFQSIMGSNPFIHVSLWPFQAAGSSGQEINQVTMTANAEGLAQGLHQASLTISDPQAINSPRTLLVTLRVKGTRHVPDQYDTIQEALDIAMVAGIAAGAINPGAEVTPDASGEFVAASAGEKYFGFYKGTAAAADGDIICILVDRGELET